MKKIAISGYGRMGKEIEKEALRKGWSVVAVADKDKDWDENKDKLRMAEVIIDFSTPQVVADNIRRAFELDIPVVVGTTGWNRQMDEIRNECERNNKSLVYGSNFSIGMNIFFEINKILARLMNDRPQYEVALREIHHIAKLDSPSGTAITLAKQIIANIGRKNSFVNTETQAADVVGIVSERIKDVPGTHIVKYASEIDDIEIKHRAKSRRGFAQGALLAAELIEGRKGFFDFNDLLFNKL